MDVIQLTSKLLETDIRVKGTSTQKKRILLNGAPKLSGPCQCIFPGPVPKNSESLSPVPVSSRKFVGTKALVY